MFTGKRKPKILRTVWVGEDGFNVMGGFRISKFTQGLGVSVSAFGVRFVAMLPYRKFGDGIAYMRVHGVVQNDLSNDAPFDGITLRFGPLVILVRPAYGGYLSKRGS